MKKLTLDTFIERSKNVHVNKYDYSLSLYKGRKVALKIICPIHGTFEQTPNAHMNGHGCAECAGNKKLTIHTFISKATKIHGQYDYSKVIMISGTHEKIKIICPNHGEFDQTVHDHLQGSNCPACVGRKKVSLQQFIDSSNELYNKLYDYSKVRMKNVDELVTIICPNHGEFLQTPFRHLRGSGCFRCLKVTNTDDFIKQSIEIHGYKYNYSKSKWIKSNVKTIIICPEHGEFHQTPNKHLYGQGCPKCLFKNQSVVDSFFKNNNISYQAQYYLKINNIKFYCDFYLPDYNLIVEYNGEQHYQPVRFNKKDISLQEAEKIFIKQQKRDNILRNYCIVNNINLLEIDGRKYQMQELTQYLTEYFKKKVA